MTTFNYDKLKGRIREVLGTQDKFADCLSISTTSVNNKLNNKVFFNQDEICKAIKYLKIKPEEIKEIFFTTTVEYNSTIIE